MTARYPRTPDNRYFVARDRLWRCTDPTLPDHVRTFWVKALMDARRSVKLARTETERSAARADVQTAKVALGERGPVWWEGDQTDWTRYHPRNTPYAGWWAALDK